MTPAEFKAWFDGFTEAFDRLPTKAQWARVKERVSEIDGKPVSERHYIDRYWPVWQRYYSNGLGTGYPTFTTGSAGVISNIAGVNSLGAASNTAQSVYCSSNAMNALGRAEAQSLAA